MKKQAIYADKTHQTDDLSSLSATFYHRYHFDGKPIPPLLWVCQAHSWRPHSVVKRPKLLTKLGEKVGWGISTPWRVVAGGRLFDYVFMTITCVSETVSGVVCLPANGFYARILEVVPYDATHVMLLCDVTCCQGTGVRQTLRTVLTQLQPFRNGITFERVEKLCRKNTAPRSDDDATDGFLLSLRELMRSGRHHPKPFLTIPGHFKAHVATPRGSATVFGGALLQSSTPGDT